MAQVGMRRGQGLVYRPVIEIGEETLGEDAQLRLRPTSLSTKAGRRVRIDVFRGEPKQVGQHRNSWSRDRDYRPVGRKAPLGGAWTSEGSDSRARRPVDTLERELLRLPLAVLEELHRKLGGEKVGG